jgi:hypothetical protein
MHYLELLPTDFGGIKEYAATVSERAPQATWLSTLPSWLHSDKLSDDVVQSRVLGDGKCCNMDFPVSLFTQLSSGTRHYHSSDLTLELLEKSPQDWQRYSRMYLNTSIVNMPRPLADYVSYLQNKSNPVVPTFSSCILSTSQQNELFEAYVTPNSCVKRFYADRGWEISRPGYTKQNTSTIKISPSLENKLHSMFHKLNR